MIKSFNEQAYYYDLVCMHVIVLVQEVEDLYEKKEHWTCIRRFHFQFSEGTDILTPPIMGIQITDCTCDPGWVITPTTNPLEVCISCMKQNKYCESIKLLCPQLYT